MSHHTLAQWVIAAATTPAFAHGTRLQVGGSVALTGDGLALAIGQALGSKLNYVETDLDEFATILNGVAGAPTGDDIADYYRHLINAPDVLARAENHDTRQLGVTPETATEWATRTLRA